MVWVYRYIDTLLYDIYLLYYFYELTLYLKIILPVDNAVAVTITAYEYLDWYESSLPSNVAFG